MLHQLRSEPGECREWAERALALERPLISRARRLQTGLLRDWARSFDGADESVRTAMGESLQLLRDAGVRLDMPYFLSLYADVLVRHGAPREALSLLDEAEERIDASTRTYFHRPEMCRLRARARLLVGEGGDLVRQDLERGAELARAMGSPAMTLRIACDRLELGSDGDDGEWRSEVSSLVARYDGQSPPPDVVRARRLLAT